MTRRILPIECVPVVDPTQTALLLIGNQAIAAESRTMAVGTLEFDITDIPQGVYVIRLRAERVDSLAMTDYDTRPPKFDDSQTVTIS